VLLGFLNVCLVTLNAVARTRDTFLLTLVHFVLLLVVVVLVVPAGIVAVAVGQAGVVAVVAAGAAWLLWRHVAGTAWLGVLRGLGPALAGGVLMTLVIALAQRLGPWPRSSVPGLLAIGSTAVVAYALPVLAFGRDRFRAASGLLEPSAEGALR
jgi:hypothetical protein